MNLNNFFPFMESYDPEVDLELGSDLSKLLNCSLEDIYVVGDDNDELETYGVTYYLSDYFNSQFDTIRSSDEYIQIVERDGNRIAYTSDHGYNNWFVAKSTIPNIPPIQNTTYKEAKDAFLNDYLNNK